MCCLWIKNPLTTLNCLYIFFFVAGQVSHGRPGPLLGERSKQLFQSPGIPVSVTVQCNDSVWLYFKCMLVYVYLKDVWFAPLQTRHFQSQPGYSASGTEHGQYSGAQPTHSPYGVTQPQHTSPFASAQPVPANYASGSQLRGIMFLFVRWFLQESKGSNCVHFHVVCDFFVLFQGASAFQAMQYLPHQQQGYAVHSHFTSQQGVKSILPF